MIGAPNPAKVVAWKENVQISPLEGEMCTGSRRETMS